MDQKLLWVEDDYYAIKGLVRPLEKSGFEVNVAPSALDAYQALLNWKQYALIVIDLIIPLTDDNQEINETVLAWAEEKYIGIGLAKWVAGDLKVTCPVILLSVVNDPISTFSLHRFSLKYFLSKRGLLPSAVKEYVDKVLESNNEPR